VKAWNFEAKAIRPEAKAIRPEAWNFEAKAIRPEAWNLRPRPYVPRPRLFKHLARAENKRCSTSDSLTGYVMN